MNTRDRESNLTLGREVSSCPACGASNCTVVGESALAFESSVGGQTFRHPAFAINYCTDCGLYFKAHTLSADELSDYYLRLNAEPFEVEGNFPTDQALYRTLNLLPAGSRILDFGCSTGRILKRMALRHECFGVEINERAASVARTRGIQIITEEQVTSGAQRDFDAIVLTDVVEHLLQPVQLLAVLTSALKRGGRLAIVTGNGDAIRDRDRVAEFWYFRLPGHLHMMSEKHVHWLAHRLDMQIDELHRCSHYDAPFIRRAKLSLQSFAFDQLRHRPRGLISKFLRFIPLLSRAERWPRSPALDFAEDHFVVVFRKP